jgi:hypothetical protein
LSPKWAPNTHFLNLEDKISGKFNRCSCYSQKIRKMKTYVTPYKRSRKMEGKVYQEGINILQISEGKTS